MSDDIYTVAGRISISRQMLEGAGLRYNDAPFSASTTDNWVARHGGLPPYVRAVARGIEKAGHSESEAIQLAIGVLKNWASGQGNVTAKTRAKAAEAVAHWEAMKASTGGRAATGDHAKGHPFYGNQHQPGTGPAVKLKSVDVGSKRGPVSPAATAAKAAASKAASAAKSASSKASTAAKSAANKVTSATVSLQKAQAAAAAVRATQQLRIATATQTAQNAISAAQARTNQTRGPANLAASNAVTATETAHSLALNTIEVSAQAAIAAADARVASAQTKLNTAKKAAGVRDMGPVTESSSAGDLLPQGPVPQPPKPRQAKLLFASAPHAFRGKNIMACTACGQPATSLIHKSKRVRASGSRHAGPHGHLPVSTGHVAGNLHRSRMAQKAAFSADADTIEPQFEAVMHKVFALQQTATLSRLRGKRGKQMMNRAAAPPSGPDEGATPPQGASTTPPAATNIFDIGFWASRTAELAQPVYEAAGKLSTNRVDGQLGPIVDTTDKTGSLSSVTDILQARAKRMADDVTQTTHDAIQKELAEGHDAGENMGQLALRVKGVFAKADINRAKLIARTESIGALNESAHGYAKGLPKSVVGVHEWLSHKDARTRETHRMADGQSQPIDQPFHVGESLMMYPGDPDAPADEVCNCRCSQLFKRAVQPASPALEAAA